MVGKGYFSCPFLFLNISYDCLYPLNFVFMRVIKEEVKRIMNALNTLTLTDYIQQYGTAASIALFDPAFKIFKVEHVKGIIGYRPEGKCAVVFGDPLCAESDRAALTNAFATYCKNKNMSIIYTAVSDQFRTWALQGLCKSAIQMGHEIIIDPFKDPRNLPGPHANLLRRKIKKSIFDGIYVYEYTNNDPAIEVEMNHVANAWLANRHGPQIYYAQTDLFADKPSKRWFYAQQGESIIGVLVLNRIDAKQGWVINILMKHPEAPDHVSEYMVISAMDILRNEGCHYLSTGPLPSPNLGTVEGLNPVYRVLTKISYAIAKKIFNLNERQRYWKKFEPRKEPSFLLFSNSSIGYHEIKGIMSAFNAQLIK